MPPLQVTYYKNNPHDTQFHLCVLMVVTHNNVNILVFTDNATTVHCELYIRSFGSISPVTMVSLVQSFRLFRVKTYKHTHRCSTILRTLKFTFFSKKVLFLC